MTTPHVTTRRTFLDSPGQLHVVIDGRIVATIQRNDDGTWRIVIPFGHDSVTYATQDAAVAAVVGEHRTCNAHVWRNRGHVGTLLDIARATHWSRRDC